MAEYQQFYANKSENLDKIINLENTTQQIDTGTE